MRTKVRLFLHISKKSCNFAHFMEGKDLFYRTFSYLCHQLTAWNSRGEGVHSPYLFELVHFIIPGKCRYYIWDEIETYRHQLATDSTTLQYLDFGSKGDKKGKISTCSVCEIAKNSLEKTKYAQLLFRLVDWLGKNKRMENPCSQSYDGLNIIELGSSLGITTSYLASVDTNNSVETYEGCPDVACVARKGWERLGLHNIRCVEGNIDETFDSKSLLRNVDFAFIDANHTQDATCRYFNILLNHLNKKSVVVVDDIYYSSDMAAAWKWIKNHPSVTTTIDLYKMGIVFFDSCYLHKHYKIKL